MIPLKYFQDEALAAFQETITGLFLGNEDRGAVKRHLQLFIQRIVITLPKVEIIGRPDVVLAVLQNKKAVRTDDAVLTAVGSWLPNTDDCENLKYAFILMGCEKERRFYR